MMDYSVNSIEQPDSHPEKQPNPYLTLYTKVNSRINKTWEQFQKHSWNKEGLLKLKFFNESINPKIDTCGHIKLFLILHEK